MLGSTLLLDWGTTLPQHRHLFLSLSKRIQEKKKSPLIPSRYNQWQTHWSCPQKLGQHLTGYNLSILMSPSSFFPSTFYVLHNGKYLRQGSNRKASLLWSSDNLLSEPQEGGFQVCVSISLVPYWGRRWHRTKSYSYHLLQLAKLVSAANCGSQFSP